jgi:chemotaxis protein CheY-P-specific phosphatase CheC
MIMKATDISGIQKKVLSAFWKKTFEDAANALSLTLQKKIQIKSFKMAFLELNKIPALMNPENTKSIVVWSRIEKPLSVVAISSGSDNVLRFADMLLHKAIGFFNDLSDQNVSVISEVENLIAGYFADTFNRIFNEEIIIQDPQLSVNPNRAVEFFDIGKMYEKIHTLTIMCSLFVPENNTALNVFLIIKYDSMKDIMDKIDEMAKISF